MATLIDEGKTLLVHGTRIHPAKKYLGSGLHFGKFVALYYTNLHYFTSVTNCHSCVT